MTLIVRKDFINRISKGVTIQVKIDILDYIKMKDFFSSDIMISM